MEQATGAGSASAVPQEDNTTGIAPRLANLTDVSGGDGEGGPVFALKLEQPTGGCGEAIKLQAYGSACGGSTTTPTAGAAAQQGGAPLPFKQENKLFLGGLAYGSLRGAQAARRHKAPRYYDDDRTTTFTRRAPRTVKVD